MAVTQEPILSRLDRLDNLMRHLESLRGSKSKRSPKSTSPSTSSDWNDLFSAESRDKLHCRPIDDVIVETEHKGTLLDRVALIEHRLLKLEKEMDSQKQQAEPKSPRSHNKSGLKQFVKSCVKPTKSNPNN